MRAPSGEKKGFTLRDSPAVSCRRAPPGTSASQMFGFPEREEKKAIFFMSGDQFGWKSPPRPVVSWRALPCASEWIQMFISPERSELKAMEVPSGDQAPRLSSRVVLITASG